MAEQASTGARKRARKMIATRPRVSRAGAFVLAAAFALMATPLVNIDSWLQSSDSFAVVEGSESPITVRIPQFSGFGAEGAADRLQGGQVVVARGQMVDADTAALVRRIQAERPTGTLSFGAFFVGLFLLGLLYSSHLRRSHRGRLVRTQIVTMGLLIGVAAAIQVALVFTPMSVLVVPVAALAIIATLAVDVSVGLATGLAVSMLLAFLVPFDAGTVAVLAVQAFASVLAIAGFKKKPSRVLLAGFMGGAAAATAYAVFFFLANHDTPLHELEDPIRSAWVASLAGGVLSGMVALPAHPIYQWLCGEITKNRLVELEDLSNPMLKQIAENSPGTWQHSLAMANMAEIAANSIGASGRLVRVGAYYHDLGKSLQPSYFIENLRSGEQSPHDRLPPEVSCDAIFAHVTEGVAQGRRDGLPERIIDFMHMHHGDGLLEYFWTKCQESGNPKNLTEDDFRYPGVRPQTRETAILAIVDAVEAASRTLKNPDDYAIRNLVQKLVYGKLHLGQLDESGLTVADLRRISNALVETIKHAYHGRIEYPWQKKEREATADGTTTDNQRPRAPSELAVQATVANGRQSATQRFIDEPRLDSLDAPRPYWRPSIRANTNASPSEAAASKQAIDAYAATAQSDSNLEAQVESATAAALNGAVPTPAPVPTPTPTPEQAVTPAPQAPSAAPSAAPAADAASRPTPKPTLAGTPVPPPAADSEPSASAAPSPSPAPAAAAPAPAAPAPAPAPAAPAPAPQPEPAPAPAPAPEPTPVATDVDHTETVLLLQQKKRSPADTDADTDPGRATAPADDDDDDLDARPTLERPAVRPPAEAAATEPVTEPRAAAEPASEPLPPDSAENLAVWNDALHTATYSEPTAPADAADPDDAPTSVRKAPPPPPGSRARHGRGTIPLMKGDDAVESEETSNGDKRAITRADTDDDTLAPGVMVLGPPPATHKSKK